MAKRHCAGVVEGDFYDKVLAWTMEISLTYSL
jgi:hypothetical protein